MNLTLKYNHCRSKIFLEFQNNFYVPTGNLKHCILQGSN